MLVLRLGIRQVRRYLASEISFWDLHRWAVQYDDFADDADELSGRIASLVMHVGGEVAEGYLGEHEAIAAVLEEFPEIDLMPAVHQVRANTAETNWLQVAADIGPQLPAKPRAVFFYSEHRSINLPRLRFGQKLLSAVS